MKNQLKEFQKEDDKMQVTLAEILEQKSHVDPISKLMENWENLDSQEVENTLGLYYSSHNLFDDIVPFYLCIPKLGELSFKLFLDEYRKEFENSDKINSRITVIQPQLMDFLKLFKTIPENVIREIIFPLLHFNRKIMENITATLNFSLDPQVIVEILNYHLKNKSIDMVVMENLFYLLHKVDYSVDKSTINSLVGHIISNNLFNDSLFGLKYASEFIGKAMNSNPELLINHSFSYLSKSKDPYIKSDLYNKINAYYSQILNNPLPDPFKTKLLIDQFSNHDVYPVESMDAFEISIFNSIIFNNERELRRIFSHLPLFIAIIYVGEKIKEIVQNNQLFFWNNFYDEIIGWLTEVDKIYSQNMYGNNFPRILEFLLNMNIEEVNLNLFEKINGVAERNPNLMIEYIRSLSRVKTENNFAILSSLFLNYSEIGANYNISQSIREALNNYGN